MVPVTPVTFSLGAVVALASLVLWSWVHLRHAGWAILTALAPLPGFAIAAVMTGASSALAYLPGFIAASFLAGTVVAELASQPPPQAMRRAFATLWLAVVGGGVSIAVLPWLLAWDVGHIAVPYARAVVIFAGILSAAVIVMAVGRWIPASDNFVIQINRLREIRERQLHALEFTSQPRWGSSIAGIALVISVLGFFGSGGSLPDTVAGLAGSAPVLLVVAYVVTRNMRRALAILFAMVPAFLVTGWIAVRLAMANNGDLHFALCLSIIPVLVFASEAARLEREGDPADVATRRSLEQSAASIFLTLLAAASAVLLASQVTLTGLGEAMTIFMGAVAAMIFAPALTTLFYSLFPRRISLEEAFRKR